MEVLMLKKKKMKPKTVIVIIIGVLIVGICSIVGFISHWLNNAEVNMYSVTHIDYVVSNGQYVDYHVFLKPDKTNHILNEISEEIRLEIADYMKSNNLKLKAGKHYIPKKSMTDGIENEISYEEYIEGFSFEKIQE